MDTGEKHRAEAEELIGEFQLHRPAYAEVYGAFLASELPMKLNEMPPRFAQKHNVSGAFTREDFIAILGPDVDHITHPIRQWEVLKMMLEGVEHLTEEDCETLEFAAVVHDLAEAVTVAGDVAFADKTAENDAEEEVALPHVLTLLLGEERGQAVHLQVKAALDRTTELGSIFYLSEKLGYAMTQLRAWHASNSSFGLNERQRWVLYSIATEIDYHLPQLEESRDKYPFIDQFLRQNAAALATMQQLSDVATIQAILDTDTIRL